MDKWQDGLYNTQINIGEQINESKHSNVQCSKDQSSFCKTFGGSKGKKIE
jgi:hypothetical protein